MDALPYPCLLYGGHQTVRTMTGKDRNEDSGRYTDTYPNEIFLNTLRDLGGAAGTRAVAEQVGCHRDTARRRLAELAGENVIERNEVGDSILWSFANTEH